MDMTLRNKLSKHYNVMKENKIIYKDMLAKDVRLLSQTKEKPLGHNKSARTQLIKNGKEHLLGYYVILL